MAEQLKKIILRHNFFDLEEYFPLEEILTFKQLYYLIVILVIYFCIMTFFIKYLYSPTSELIIINSIIDIVFSVYITVSLYDGSTKSKIISIFLIPFASISHLLFGGSVIGYWDFIRIPTLLYLVVHFYNKFRAFTHKNNLDKLILLLLTIIYICSVFTLIAEDKNPINAFAMVSNAFTSNSYLASGQSSTAVLVSALVGWSGYIISGIGTASLASAIILRKFDKKFEKLESENNADEMKELKMNWKQSMTRMPN